MSKENRLCLDLNMDISIIITTYNYAQYLNQCIDSCLKQKDCPLEYEVIVIDDGSTDGTKELLEARKDVRLRAIHLSNSGIEVASNRGFDEARGRFVVRVDADDLLKPDYLSVMSDKLDSESRFIYPDYEIIDGKGNLQDSIKLPLFSRHEIMRRGDFLATGTIYPRNLLQSLGGYNTEMRNCGLENYELILKFIQNGVEGIHVPSSLFHYRRHSCNISTKRLNDIVRYGQNLFKKNNIGSILLINIILIN